MKPHLEYCVHSWNTHFVKDEEVLEEIQKRVTKCVKGMKVKKYLERLRILGLTTLKGRRIRGDLIETLFCLETKTLTLRSSSSSQIPVVIREATV